MRANDQELVRTSIEEDEPPPDALRRLERLGEPAFDAIRAELAAGTLSPRQQVNALRRLALIARQACVHLDGKVLDTAVILLRSDSVMVRSAAASVAIWTCLALEQLANPQDGGVSSVEEARSTISGPLREALEAGLEPAQASFAGRFLEGARLVARET